MARDVLAEFEQTLKEIVPSERVKILQFGCLYLRPSGEELGRVKPGSFQ